MWQGLFLATLQLWSDSMFDGCALPENTIVMFVSCSSILLLSYCLAFAFLSLSVHLNTSASVFRGPLFPSLLLDRLITASCMVSSLQKPDRTWVTSPAFSRPSRVLVRKRGFASMARQHQRPARSCRTDRPARTSALIGDTPTTATR